MAIFALILAAGFSSRMEPAFKPLLELPFNEGRKTALARLCDLYQAEGVRPVAVAGHRHEEIQAVARERLTLLAYNPHPERGMLSSIQAGIKFLPENCEAFFIHPVDIPLARRMTIRLLLTARDNSASCAIPVHADQEGHPLMLAYALRHLILNRHHPAGLRGILRDMQVEIRHVPTADSFILRDMDRLEDYADLCELAPFVEYLYPQEALNLLKIANVPQKGIAHGMAVGSIAAAFAECMKKGAKGICKSGMNARLAMTGGLLHDICKGAPRHEEKAGCYLRTLGLEKLAPLVEDHRDLILPAACPVTERELVYLADKYVYGARPVTLQERFAQKLRVFEKDPQACAAIKRRQGHAGALAARFEYECGRDPEKVAFSTLL